MAWQTGTLSGMAGGWDGQGKHWEPSGASPGPPLLTGG